MGTLNKLFEIENVEICSHQLEQQLEPVQELPPEPLLEQQLEQQQELQREPRLGCLHRSLLAACDS